MGGGQGAESAAFNACSLELAVPGEDPGLALQLRERRVCPQVHSYKPAVQHVCQQCSFSLIRGMY